MSEQNGIEVRRYEEGTGHEFVAVTLAGHTIQLTERDGDPHLYVQDHASIRIEGELKDEVTVVVGEDEFPTEIETLSEREFYERYHDKG
jgi:hypothetical protein